MKKKLLLLTIIAALCLCLFACSEDKTKKSKKSDSESTSEDDSTSVPSAEEILKKTSENMKARTNFRGTAKLEMHFNMSMSMNGETVDLDYKDITNEDYKRTEKYSHSLKNISKTQNDKNTTATKEEYIDYESGTSYTSTDDGNSWEKAKNDKENKKILDMLLAGADSFKHEDVGMSDNNYVISIDAAKAEGFTKEFTKSFAEAFSIDEDKAFNVDGNITIIIDKDFLPVSIEIKNLSIDKSLYEKIMKDRMGNTENIDLVCNDFSINCFAEYSGWDTVSEDEVKPSDDIISKA